jgi:phage-related protein
MKKSKIEFIELHPHKKYGVQINRLFYVVKNGRSLLNKFNDLNERDQYLAKDLISKMATNDSYKSPGIKYNLKGYNYGEIRPMPHRFFFFQKCGDNYIFFHYELKKTDSLGDDTYKKINDLKREYEEEFKKQYEEEKL